MAKARQLLACVGVAALLVSLLGTGVVLAAPGASGGAKAEVIVGYGDLPGRSEIGRLQAHGATIRLVYKTLSAVAIEAPVASLSAIRGDPGVRWVEPDHPLQLFDHVGSVSPSEELGRTWGVWHIGAGDVHAAGNQGAGIRVAVIDTGIDCSHPDLDANCDGGVSFVPGVVFPGGVPFDDYGHGTHVAGTIAAERSPDGQGVVGVAPLASVVAYKVLDSSGTGEYSYLAAALDEVTARNTDGNPANDIDVVNMSLGGSEASTLLEAAIVQARSSGAILVAASGNVNPYDIFQLLYGCPVAYPARYSQVLSTTFTNPSDALTGYSCTGPEVDFASPGDGVYSTVPRSGPFSNASGYGYGSGTSMASPHLAGTVALALAQGIPASEVATHLCANTSQGFGVLSTPIPASDPRYPQYFGCGVVDADKALVDNPPGGGGGGTPNSPPAAEAGGPYGGAEGAPSAISGSASDPDAGDTLSYGWTATAGPGVDTGATCAFASPSAAATTVSCTDDGSWTLTLTVNDGHNPAVSDSAVLALANANPTVTISAPAAGVAHAVGATVSLSAAISDAGVNDSRACQVAWGDGSSGAGALSSGTCTASHAYAAAGSPTITVTATDDEGGTGTASVGITIDAGPPPPVQTLAFVPVADAQVRSNRPKANFGSLGSLRVRSSTFESYLRFTVSGVSGTVTGARLRLWVSDASNSGGTAYAVADNSWGETTITWNNRPARGATLGGVAVAAVGTWVEFNLGTAVSGNGTFSFALSGGSTDAVDYHSREGANDPQLVVTFQ